jgi:hypothetical protein
LLAYFLIYSFEFRSGYLDASELGNPIKNRFQGFKKNSIEQTQANVLNKYSTSEIDLEDSLLTKSIWKTLFTSGLIPSADINKMLSNTKYFKSANQPDWVRLLAYKNLTDSEFEQLLIIIKNKWNNKEYEDVGVIMHLAGVLMHFSEIGLHKEDEDQILDFAKQYIDELRDKDQLPLNSELLDSFFDQNICDAHEFYSSEKDAFKKLKAYLSEQMNTVLQESYKMEAEKLLGLMQKDTSKFMQSLILSNHEDNKFYEIPILLEIDPELFVNATITLLEVSPEQFRLLASTFRGRYEKDTLNRKLVSELDWLERVAKLLEIKKRERSGKLSGCMLDWLMQPYLNDAIKKLKSFQSTDLNEYKS